MWDEKQIKNLKLDGGEKKTKTRQVLTTEVQEKQNEDDVQKKEGKLREKG